MPLFFEFQFLLLQNRIIIFFQENLNIGNIWVKIITFSFFFYFEISSLYKGMSLLLVAVESSNKPFPFFWLCGENNCYAFYSGQNTWTLFSHYFSQTRACHWHGLCHTGGPGFSLNLVRNDNLRPRNLYRIFIYYFGKFQGIKRLGSEFWLLHRNWGGPWTNHCFQGFPIPLLHNSSDTRCVYMTGVLTASR